MPTAYRYPTIWQLILNYVMIFWDHCTVMKHHVINKEKIDNRQIVHCDTGTVVHNSHLSVN